MIPAMKNGAGAQPRTDGMPRLIRRGAFLCAFLILGLGGWSAVADISSAVIAPGELVVETSPKKVQHPTGGIVGEILVSEGDAVVEGQVLARLDETSARANLSIIERQLDALQGRAARLDAEKIEGGTLVFPNELLERATFDPEAGRIVEDERRLFETRRSANAALQSELRERVRQTREEIGGLTEQLAARTRETALIKDELAGVQALWDKNLVGISRRNVLERDAIRLEGEQGALRASIAQAKGRIAEIELQMLRSEQDFRGEALRLLRDVEAQVAELQERRISAYDQLRRIEIRAPQKGVVHQRTINTAGGVVGPGEVLMLIVPVQEDLVIDARINPIDRDQIHEGQKAVVRFPALNQRTTPDLTGVLERISADVSRENVPGLPPQSHYTARIRLSAEEARKIETHRLRPGMPAEAYIQSQSRPALSYFMRPIADNFARTFRER